MSRRRAPHNDFICLRCGCPCDAAGSRHLGGGQGMKACGKPPHAILRSSFDEDNRAIVAQVVVSTLEFDE